MVAQPLETILQFVRTLHAAGDPVLQFLPCTQVERWLVAGEWEKVRFLLRKLPLTIIPDTPEFFCVRGHAFWGQHRLEEARRLFEKAHYFYRMTRDDLILSALSCIEIADIAHSRRQYQDASHYLQVAKTLLAAAPTVNPYVRARYNITYAVVQHDLGHLQAAIDHAQAAYSQFETIKDAPSQLFCLMAIASAAVQMGKLDLAASQTAVAHSSFATNAIPALYYARILNTEVHITWHRGDLTQALKTAVQLYQYATQQAIPHQRLCVHHLGDVALGPLTRLQQSDEPALRLRAQRLLDALQQSSFFDLDFVKDDHIRAVLMQLLAERKLCRAGLPLLFAQLTTAEHQRTANPTLVAVFGLYLAGLPREAIAERLGYSVQLVRNYISEIYGRFEVTKEERPKKKARWERLYALAREAGFV